jgi:prephenate dehydrogenase
MKVSILGVGLIGGSIGLAASQRLRCEVVGFDPNPNALRHAIEKGAISRGADTVAAACEGADAVFCAAPVAALAELARAALDATGPEAIVTDVGSTKWEIAVALGESERFIGGHPLAGAETAGVENARGDLFEGARWYLTPIGGVEGAAFEQLQQTVTGLGARPQAIEAEAHDRLMATVSHLPHVLANALAGVAVAELSTDSEQMPEVGPSFRDATRVAGSNPAVWADIFAANRESVANAIEALVGQLNQAVDVIRGGDRDAVTFWHHAAAIQRRRLLETELTGEVLRELRIVVANRPGKVAELSQALADAGVNIEDMVLHPAPSDGPGAISLWVAGHDRAASVARLARELGHTVSAVEDED